MITIQQSIVISVSLLLLQMPCCFTIDDDSMPTIFALRLIGTRNYVSLAFDETDNLVIRNYEVETPELFEKIEAPIGVHNHFTQICIRSVFNEHFFTIDETNNHILKANELEISRASQFIIYYGPNKTIGLKSVESGTFVKTKIINNDTLIVTGSDDSTNDAFIFEYEYFETPIDYPIYEIESPKPEIKIAPLERLKFPKTFALKSQSGHNIGVDKTELNQVYARTNVNDNWETFQVLYFPDIGSSIMCICLKSLGNGMYLSANPRKSIDSQLVLAADSRECSDTEKFEVHYGNKNTVGLRSRVNQKFLGTSEDNNQPLAFKKNQFESFEIKKVFDKSHFPRFFALQSVANGKFIKIEDSSSKLIKADGLNQNDNVIFMYILIAEPNEKSILSNQNETMISIQSKLTRNVLSVSGKRLVADTSEITDSEEFLVYHGPNDIIGLKSKSNNHFIGAYSSKFKPLSVNRKSFGRFEMFKVIEIFEKFTFPKLFSLRAKSNRNFIHVEDDSQKAMKANSDVPYEGTAFEAIILPDIEKKEGAFIISFRSLINGKLLSAKHERLYANAESLSNTEKFYVYYSSNNVIGLKSKASGEYLSAHPSTTRQLKVDRGRFRSWEMFEIVTYN